MFSKSKEIRIIDLGSRVHVMKISPTSAKGYIIPKKKELF